VGERNTNILLCENLQSPISASGDLLLQLLLRKIRQGETRRREKRREKKNVLLQLCLETTQARKPKRGGGEERGEKGKRTNVTPV